MSCTRANSALVRNSFFFTQNSEQLQVGWKGVLLLPFLHTLLFYLLFFLNNLYFPEVFTETHNEINCLKLELS